MNAPEELRIQACLELAQRQMEQVAFTGEMDSTVVALGDDCDDIVGVDRQGNTTLLYEEAAKQPIAFCRADSFGESLDDTVIWGSLDMMSRGDDPTIVEFSARLLHRELYKSMDIRQSISEALPSGAATSVVDLGCQRALEYLRSFSHEDGPARLLIDQTSRKPYKRLQESKGPLNQIMIRTRDNSLIDVAKISQVVDAVEEFKVLRAYAAADDSETKKLVQDAIKKGVEHALAN